MKKELIKEEKDSGSMLNVSQLKGRLRKLKSDRGTWETHWQEITDYIVPRKNTVLSKKYPGEKRTWQLLDNVGVQANELLAGSLHGLLTNPNAEWFELTTGDYALDNNDNVREWLQTQTTKIHNVLNNSNFQTEVHEVYIDLGSIGTSCLLVEKSKKSVVRFSSKFITDYYIGESPFGTVDEVHREWKWTAHELINEFGMDKMPKKVLEAFEKKSDAKFTVVHAVYPRYRCEPEYNGTSKFISQNYIPECDHIIDSGRFEEMPYIVTRWGKATGETYGRSPGMTALPELKVLNKMNETILIGAQKQVDPPIQMPDDGFVRPIITRPGGINYFRAGSNDYIKPIFNDTRMDFGYQAMEDRRKRVRDAYYVDQLQLQQAQGAAMTATEVMQRTEQQMRLLGPMLGRQQAEFLRPLVDRVFNIMWREGLIDPPPSELSKVKGRLDVRYSSLIAKSQRVAEGQNIQRALQAVSPFIQLDPSVADNFNGDQAVRALASIYGMPQQMLNNADVVQQKRDQRAQQQAQLQQMAQQQHDAQVTQANVKSMKDMVGQ